MTTLTFVVEGRQDAAALRHLLGDEADKARFFAAGGRTSLVTVARNVVVHEGTPVMVVKDADTRDIGRMQEDRTILRVALRHVAPGALTDVFEFVPELEAIFFEAPSVLDKIKPGLSNDQAFVATGMLAPREALAKVLGKPLQHLFEDLDDSSWALVRKGAQASAFVEAVNRLQPH